MLIIGYLFPLIFKKGYLNMKKGGSADPPRKVFLCSFLNYVRLNYAFSALEPAVIHYSRVDRRFVAVEESRHDLACYRPEHEAVTGEACSMPEFLDIGLAKYRCRIRGHVDGIIAAVPTLLGIGTPALWECKTMNAKNWRACVKDGVAVAKPVYAAQIALYQAYMEATVPGISANPALFTAINKDTAELHHEQVAFDAALAQRMSDRGVRILQATDAGELLPRIATNRDFFEYRFCPWAARCWGLTG